MLNELGIDEGRLKLEWISAGEGTRFQEVVNNFIKNITELGPVKIR